MTAVLGRTAVRAFLGFGVVLMLASTCVGMRMIAQRAMHPSVRSAPDQSVVLNGVPLPHGLAMWNEEDRSFDVTFSQRPLSCDGRDGFLVAYPGPGGAGENVTIHVAARAPTGSSIPVVTRTVRALECHRDDCREKIDRDVSTAVLDGSLMGGRVRGTTTFDADYHYADGSGPLTRRGGGRFDVPLCIYEGPRWLRRFGAWGS